MDLIDDVEDPLGKISRQLSELAATSSALPLGLDPESVNPTLDAPWTQFSGFPSQASPTVPPFSNLYSWNSMDMPPEFMPQRPVLNLGDPTSHLNHPPPHPQSNNTGQFRAQSDFSASQTHYDWTSRGNSPPGRFQVSGDLGGRFVDVPSSRIGSTATEVNPEFSSFVRKPPQVFHSANSGFNSNFGGIQASRPSPQHMFNTSPVHTLSEHTQRSPNFHSLDPGRSLQDFHQLDNANCMPRHILQRPTSHEEMSHSPHMHTPLFDPRTPPPSVPIKKQRTESLSIESHSPKLGKNPEVLELLQKSNITLDLGTSISGHQYSSIEMAEDGKQLYESALNQWQSQDVPTANEILKENSGQENKEQEKVEEPSSAESSKPSYSDIAKTPKTGAGAQSPVPKSEIPAFDVRAQGKKLPVKKDVKPVRPHVKRSSSGSKFFPRGSIGEDSDAPKVSPSSRYGLDSFEDLTNAGSHSSSAESLIHAVRSRRGSGSSVGSGINTLDDISTGNPGQVFSDTDVRQMNPRVSSASKSPTPAEKKASNLPSKSASNESIFFDPRRIFQSKNTNKSRQQPGNSSSNTKSKGSSYLGSDDLAQHASGDATVLNNGKPTAGHSSSKLSSSGQHDYINNDLRDANKLTNQTAAENGQQAHHGKREAASQMPRSGSARKSSGRANNGVYRKDKRKNPDVNKEEPGDELPNHQNRFGFLPDNWDMERLEEWCSMAYDKVKLWGNAACNSMLNLLIYLLGLIFYLGLSALHLFLLLVGKTWTLIKEKLLKGLLGSKGGSGWNSKDYLRRRVGLEENINLPATGEEAMKRLLACKGKDPYSILGLRADSSDEDIKKYYRKQAILVHPDKNQEPGAEEAFKILGHAFEMIGDPGKRKQYDSHTQEANEAEKMREFAEMLSKLQTKIQEAANIMRCDNCGGRHRRVPVDRPFYSARFCQRCNIHHSAKEGDVWAESTMLGFYWHYYALMEGHVFDITEWMKCHKEFFKHMKANTHGVLYRIATDGNKKNRHHQSNEGNLEDIINRLFSRSPGGRGPTDGSRPSWNPPHPGTEPNWSSGNSGGVPSAAATGVKKGRKKKKR